MKIRFGFCRIGRSIWRKNRTSIGHIISATWVVQSISKEADSLTRVEFYSLMEQVFSLPEVQELVAEAVQNHGTGGGS